MKRIRLTLIIAALSLTACSLLKKTKQSLKQVNMKEQLELVKHRHTLTRQSQLIFIDSSHRDFNVMLLPKGKFKFSIQNGFEGEAEKIWLSAKKQQVTSLHQEHQIKVDSTVRKATYHKNKKSTAKVEKNKLRMGNSWSWLLIIPILWVCFSVYKRANSA